MARIIASSGTASEAEAIVAFEDIAIERNEKKYRRAMEAVGTLSPWVLNPEFTNPYDQSARSELFFQAIEAMDQLPAVWAETLRLRFGLEGHDKRTLQQIGDERGCTRENVRGIQERALKRLRGILLAKEREVSSKD